MRLCVGFVDQLMARGSWLLAASQTAAVELLSVHPAHTRPYYAKLLQTTPLTSGDSLHKALHMRVFNLEAWEPQTVLFLILPVSLSGSIRSLPEVYLVTQNSRACFPP